MTARFRLSKAFVRDLRIKSKSICYSAKLFNIFSDNAIHSRINYLYMKIHFVGCNGASMSALKDFAAARGNTVTGSDAAISGHNAQNVEGCDLVVYTNAVPIDNCELNHARQLHIPIVERAKFLGELAATYDKVIAVAGCHGKSTTCAMLGTILENRNASLHIGVKGASKVAGRKLFVTEACEYRASFLRLNPDIGVLLSTQYDHPDFYSNQSDLFNAYGCFCNQCKTAVVNGDDEGARTACKNKNTVYFGLKGGNTYTAQDIRNDCGYRRFTVVKGKTKAAAELSVAGQFNVYNALAAIAAANIYGVPLDEACALLKDYCGIPRRFERRGIAFGKTVFSDYAHHPFEAANTIATAKEMFNGVAVVFQPHTYTRTAAFCKEFADSLSAADTVVLAPIFAARENAIDGVSSHNICRELVSMNKRAYCFDTFYSIIEFCKRLEEKAIIFMGAGDIDAAADLFIEKDREQNRSRS